jgi:hypothetical protein
MIIVMPRLGNSTASEQSHIRHRVRDSVFQLKAALKRILVQGKNSSFISIQVTVMKHIQYNYINTINQKSILLHYAIRPVLFNMFHLLKSYHGHVLILVGATH